MTINLTDINLLKRNKIYFLFYFLFFKFLKNNFHYLASLDNPLRMQYFKYFQNVTL